MHQEHGDGSEHPVCPNCTLCVECGDCIKYGCGSEIKPKAN